MGGWRQACTKVPGVLVGENSKNLADTVERTASLAQFPLILSIDVYYDERGRIVYSTVQHST
jgi:hypothetical protein